MGACRPIPKYSPDESVQLSGTAPTETPVEIPVRTRRRRALTLADKRPADRRARPVSRSPTAFCL